MKFRNLTETSDFFYKPFPLRKEGFIALDCDTAEAEKADRGEINAGDNGTTMVAPKKNSEARIRARNEAKILKAAVDLFSRKGFDGTRIAEISQASGLPKANVYYYFETKEAIYATLIERLLAGWDEALGHIDPAREPEEALRDYIRAKMDYSRKHLVDSRFFANEMLRGGRFLSRKQKKHMQKITKEKAAVIEGWIRDGKMAPVDPNHLFMTIWASTQFYADFATVAAVTLCKNRLTARDYEEAYDNIVTLVLNGCLKPATA